ncbi:MAG TPA: STAS domain-containing protein [Thermoanaerobaculia bacterium]|nr:STAS domain-containing protein [Thermoanaerobaculia bacterium]
MNIVKNQHEGITILDIQGVVKLGESAREFSGSLDAVLHEESGPVLINFEGINYMDSTGLGELIGYLQRFEDRKRKMALLNPNHRIQALLRITRLDSIFRVFEGREEAIAYLTPEPD